MISTIKKIYYLLSPKERNKGFLLLTAVFLMTILDLLGVASIMPLISIMTNASLIKSNKILFFLYSTFKFNNEQKFLLFLGQLVLFLFVISILFKAFTTYYNLKFINYCEYNMSKRLIDLYLHQPYEWFLNKNSADIGKTILHEINLVIAGGLMQLITLIVNGSLIIAILCLILFVNPSMSIKIGLVIGITYGLIFQLTNKFLNKIGQERSKSNQARFNIVSEAFGGIKEVKVGGHEKSFINRFRLPASNYAKAHANSLIIAQVPRFALEGIAFGGILILILLLISKGNSLSSVSPTIALFTISGYRLMPAIQQVYTTISQIKYTKNAIDQLYDEFTLLKNNSTNIIPINRLNFNKSIKLKSIEYSYPNSKKEILQNLNLFIPINSKIGIVGSTGSGKTTTVDIILGLLDPTSGQFEIDDIKITNDNKRSWQENISYVPQNIYLSDDTIASNIAFGIETKNINLNAVEKASKIANLHNFIINELPYGYQTQIGERGIRLSGGQRQRIGIARALYNSPKLLILDEATSALDNLTENGVMDAINNLGNDITIIIIAHRLSTVKNCDKIFLMDKGAIISSGTYDTLSEKSESFIKLLNNK
jgi:ABC-type multidrug transport system fused ATPase/permease subunit